MASKEDIAKAAALGLVIVAGAAALKRNNPSSFLVNRTAPGAGGLVIDRPITYLHKLADEDRESWHPAITGQKQSIIGGHIDDILYTTTEFNQLMGGWNWNADAWQGAMARAPMPGTLRKFLVEMAVAPGPGDTVTFTLYVSGYTAVEVVIAGTDTTGSDLVNEAAVARGDLLVVREVPFNFPAYSKVMWSFEFEGSEPGCISLFNHYYDVTTTQYGVMIGCGGDSDHTKYRTIMPFDGTMKSLVIQHENAPGAGKSVLWRVRKNGANTALLCTVADAAVAAEDLANEVSFVRGDQFNIQIDPNGSPAAGYAAGGVQLVPDVAGENAILGNCYDYMQTTVTEYNYLSSGWRHPPFTDVEADRQQITQAATLKKLIVFLPIAAPGAGKSWTFTVMVNGAPSALTCTIADAETSGGDLVHEVVVADGDKVSLRSVPSGTPVGTSARWALISVEP